MSRQDKDCCGEDDDDLRGEDSGEKGIMVVLLLMLWLLLFSRKLRVLLPGISKKALRTILLALTNPMPLSLVCPL